MATKDLYTLTWSTRNYERSVVYTDTPARQITAVAQSIDGGPFQLGGQPDSWVYQDGQFISSVVEGASEVKFYAIRTSPYARFEVVGAPIPDDLQILNLQVSGNSVSFQVSTSNQPWSSAIDVDLPAYYTQGVSQYGNLSGGSHTIYVKDAAGYQRTATITIANPNPDPDPDPSDEPAGGIRLRIRSRIASTQGGDTWQNFGYYYFPSTRSTQGNIRLSDTTESQAYLRPETDIIDRWCVDPGAPPYRETQVTHDGQGGVTYTDVDGVSACRYQCNGTLTATSVGADGRFTVTLTAANLTGTVQYRLKGGVLQASNVFEDLPAGRYEFEVVETRANGCSASTSIVLASTYGLRYMVKYSDLLGFRNELRIKKLDYTGEAIEVCADGDNPVTLSYPGGATDHIFTAQLRGSELEMILLIEEQDMFLDTFSGSERLFKVEYDYNDAPEWYGYLLPEQYQVDHQSYLTKPKLTIRATDGLGTLSSVPFLLPSGELPTGDMLLLDVLLLCLGKLELGLPLNVRGNLYPVGADRTDSFLEAVRVDAGQYRDGVKPWDCGRVLKEILNSFQCRLCQQSGAWWLERLVDLDITQLDYFSYAPDGTPLVKARRTLLRTILAPAPLADLIYVHRRQYLSLRPAVAVVEAQADPGDLVNLLTALPLPTATTLPGWTGTAAYTLEYQGKDKQPLLRITGAQPGTTLANAKWLQSPPTAPIPLADNGSSNQRLTVRLKARAYGQVLPNPNDSAADQLADTAQMGLALKYGAKWLSAGGVVAESDTPVYFNVSFPTNNEVEVELRGFGSTQTGDQPIQIRLTEPIAGAATSPVTVDVSLVGINWESLSAIEAEGYTDTYRADNELLATRTDEENTLYHVDTRYARRRGTLLGANRIPTALWQQAPGGPQLELGTIWATYRALWQRGPAQVIGGTLRGYIGPGTLLTDPSESTPAVYAIVDYRRNPKQREVEFVAVQIRTLEAPLPPDVDLPYPLLLAEDGTPLLAEDSTYLVAEDYG